MKNVFLFAILLLSGGLFAQLKTPAPSPGSKINQTVGLTEVTIEYSRPSAKGRTIFGDLVPYDKMWRTGANASTKLTFSEDVTLGGQKLKSGAYALFTVPGKTEWEMILYKNTNTGGVPAEWNESEVAARFKVKPQTLSNNVETFTFEIADLTNSGAQIRLMWEKTSVSMDLVVNTDETVMKSIEKVMGGPTANELHAAGRYMWESGKDKNVALEYVQMANTKEPRFWTLRTEALILYDLGRVDEAIGKATQSRDLAANMLNDDYVRMNEKSLQEWAAKKKK